MKFCILIPVGTSEKNLSQSSTLRVSLNVVQVGLSNSPTI